MDIELLLSYKNNPDNKSLDQPILTLFNELFDYKNKKIYKKNVNTNIIKNQKIQNKKETITNKTILILNKLSESNINNLVIEFIDNINQIDILEYEELINTFYTKIISEINFVKNYLEFLKIIAIIYNSVQKYDLSLFYSLVESNFNLNYKNNESNTTEESRLNNLILIYKLVELEFLSTDIINIVDTVLLNQTIYLIDIYHWFNLKNKKLTPDEINIINNLLLKPEINSRESILLTSLIDNVIINNTSQNQKCLPVNTIDTFQLECTNIIEEYILLKSFDDIKFFITTKCTDALKKNRFCEYLFNIYLQPSPDLEINLKDFTELLKLFIKKQVLFKFNLNKALSLINNSNKTKLKQITKIINEL
jgi:hypothetical protein